ncbi:hypothetical protein SCUCBS95973_001847 [Sporothrix curviconia]|uniref:AAA+ ATPase domain-containing protein n=1 Tax=Sporothrix curviconia TaxID=1260050 RepID=A0ABP0B200_9PEZI
MHLMSREDMKETAWRWRCKVLHTTDERTLSDYSDNNDSSSSSSGEEAATEAKTGGTGIANTLGLSRSSKPDPKDAANTFGGSLTVKTFYEAPSIGDNFFNWQDYPPRQQSKSAAKVQDRVAIKLYKIKDKSKPVIGGRFVMKFHQIDIQNPLLVAALAPILREREDYHLDPEETATFNAPFRPLYFSYDAIVARLRGLQPETVPADATLQPFLKLLVCVLDELFAEVRAKRKGLIGRGLMSYDLAWTYFPRNAVVRSHGSNSDVLSRVLDTAYVKVMTTEMLSIRVQVLRFNGEAFIWDRQELKVPVFAGNRPIVEFDHCPLTHLPVDEQTALKTRLAERGRLVLDCQGLAYRSYTGVGMHLNEQGKMERHNVDGRVLVDVVGYNKHHLAQGVREGKDPQSTKNVVEGTGRTRHSRARMSAMMASQRRATGETIDDADVAVDPKKAAAAAARAKTNKLQRLSEEEQARNKAAMMAKPEELMFMSPMVEGYALKNKLWFSFYVEDIRPVKWNDGAYDHLVYDEQQKDLVLSFVESHGHTTSKVEDVIIGKGDGLIILLSGPPGTGKTLTAEAVADRTHRPLFYLQAEDLGINAAALGANVKKVFEMATEWDAVILLDEADVFMAERHPQDIARNELVSIFLRELEYFRGIIFLTTNLYDTIDSAFRSRVSLHLLFRPLTAEARLSVWRKFLARVDESDESDKSDKSGGKAGVNAAAIESKENDNAGEGSSSSSSGVVVVDVADKAEAGELAEGAEGTVDDSAAQDASICITDEDMVELAAWNLNGREIKTAVKMVTTWCAHKGHAMTLERLENGIRVTSPHATKMTKDSSDLYD